MWIPKKKELLGNFTRSGTHYSTERISGSDHDFPSQATGKLIPFWIYDTRRNKWMMVLNTTHDTSEMNCNAIELRWTQEWSIHYKDASEIVLLLDCGWSNASNSLLYKHYLQLLANKIGISIRITHYPPYTSKYNPIEHKMFCHVHRSCEWVMLTNVEIAQQLIEKTSTEQWLKVSVSIDSHVYETKKKIPKEHVQTVRNIPHRDGVLPQRNYVIKPSKEYHVII